MMSQSGLVGQDSQHSPIAPLTKTAPLLTHTHTHTHTHRDTHTHTERRSGMTHTHTHTETHTHTHTHIERRSGMGQRERGGVGWGIEREEECERDRKSTRVN